MPVTYSKVVAYAKRYRIWFCTRDLNNRGRLLVRYYGNQVWRSDLRCQTTVGELRADGWETRKEEKMRDV